MTDDTQPGTKADRDETGLRDAEEITDTGSPSSRIVTPMRILLAAAVVVAVGASTVLSLGTPTLGDDIVLRDAFVRGAVSHIGTDDDARIERLHVGLGDAVKTGDPLIDLLDDRLQARRATLLAGIDGIEAELRETRARHDMAAELDGTALEAARLERDATAARLDQARAQVTLLKERVERRSELAESGFATEARLSTEATELEQDRAEVDRLTARLGAADLAIERARIDAGRGAVRQAERDGIDARLQQARAELEELDLRIARRTLTALDDGVVVDVPARPGASVGTDDPILSIWDPERTWMLAWVDQDRMGRIRAGDPATVRIDSVPVPIDGTVRRILVASDGQERTLPGQPVSPILPDTSRFAVQVTFDARGLEHQVLPGMTGSVTITPEDPGADPAVSDLGGLFARFLPD